MKFGNFPIVLFLSKFSVKISHGSRLPHPLFPYISRALLLLRYLITLIIFDQNAHVVELLTALFIPSTCHFSFFRSDTLYGSILGNSFEALHGVIF
jgi:hypothetical protein